jgi:hypothetical protein
MKSMLMKWSVLLGLALSGATSIAGDRVAYSQGPVEVRIATSPLPKEFREPPDAPVQYFFGVGTLVTAIEITVNGKGVVVPLDCFFGLSDPRNVEIKRMSRPGRWELRILGGDASTAYRATLEFDKRQVRSMKIYSPAMRKVASVTKIFAPVQVLH